MIGWSARTSVGYGDVRGEASAMRGRLGCGVGAAAALAEGARGVAEGLIGVGDVEEAAGALRGGDGGCGGVGGCFGAGAAITCGGVFGLKEGAPTGLGLGLGAIDFAGVR